MDMEFTWAWIALALAMFPASMGVVNLFLVRPARGTPPEGALVSILIPARNEAANIAACLDAVLASRGVAVEVVVMDDGSTDATPAIVADYAARDARVRLEAAPPLPPGWTGKVHACARLAAAARGTHFLFIDADVRLAPDAAAQMAGHAARTGTAMVTGVPRQLIGSLGEAATVPMINFLLFCYLPGGGRAFTRRPGMAAACGQLLLVEREGYFAAGGMRACAACCMMASPWRDACGNTGWRPRSSRAMASPPAACMRISATAGPASSRTRGKAWPPRWGCRSGP
jgi:glycosyltransferase involved in cell wall biosynthesis